MFSLRLAWQSLLNRRFTSLLTLISIALSVALLMGVERVRRGARESFTGTISHTDLIVGARGSPIQLLLYAVFRMGSATNNLSYASYERIKQWPEVAWTIPYSLGDSYRGYRVVGTTEDFYRYYHYRGDKQPVFATGKAATAMFDVVLGSEVAARQHHRLGDRIVLAHGIAEVTIEKHADKPFTVTGILAPTATPIDRSLYITLQGLEAMHVDWTDGAPPRRGDEAKPADLATRQLPIDDITAFLVGTRSRLDILNLQRRIDEDKVEPLMAIIPGVALGELWDGLAYAEDTLRVVSGFVVVIGMIGMLVAIYHSLSERRREMAILRSLGAGPQLIFTLMIVEAGLLTGGGVALGGVGIYAALALLRPLIDAQFGLYLPLAAPSVAEWCYLAAIVGFGLLLGAIPAYRAYKNTLSDGLTIRV